MFMCLSDAIFLSWIKTSICIIVISASLEFLLSAVEDYAPLSAHISLIQLFLCTACCISRTHKWKYYSFGWNSEKCMIYFLFITIILQIHVGFQIFLTSILQVFFPLMNTSFRESTESIVLYSTRSGIKWEYI